MKNRQMKLYIILALLFVVLVFSGALLSGARRGRLPTETKAPEPIPAAFPKSVANPNVKYSLSVPTVTVPENVPVYVFDVSAAAGKTNNIAVNEGFTSPPQKTETSRGTRYFWKSGSRSITVLGTVPSVYYFSGIYGTAPSESVGLAPLREKATNTINRLGILPTNASLSGPEPVFTQATGPDMVILSTDTKATGVVLKYGLTLSGLPVFVGSPLNDAAQFRFKPDGTVLSYSVYDLSSINKTAGEQRVATPEEASLRLTGGSGTIIAAYPKDGYEKMYASNYDFSRVNVTKTEFGYYLNPETTEILPAYVFSGSATNNKSGGAIEVIVLVSGIK